MQWIFLLILIVFLFIYKNKIEGFDQKKDIKDKDKKDVVKDKDTKDVVKDKDTKDVVKGKDKKDKVVTMDNRDMFVDMCPRDYNIKQIKLKQIKKVNQLPGYTSHITFDAMRRIPDPDIPFPVDPDFFNL